MREIKFRGLAANGEFAFGCLLKDRPNSTNYYETFSQRISWFCDNGGDYNVPVMNGTVGQYTGLKDCEGTEIYEGDIVECDLYAQESGTRTEKHFGTVVYNEFEYAVEMEDDFWPLASWKCVASAKVIGNIHTTPELIK